MAHPYFTLQNVFDDIPKLDEERDNNWVIRLGEESDDEIDNLLPSPTISVPLDTVPDIIAIASTLRTEGKVYQKWGEEERGQKLIDSSTKKVDDYITTAKMNSSDRDAVVTIIDGDINDFENSPLMSDYFNTNS